MRPGVVEGEGIWIWIWGFDSDSRTFTSSAGGELFCRGVQLISLHN